MRKIVIVVCLVFPAIAAGQDMPLSQVLIDGEGWKEVKLPAGKPVALTADGKGSLYVADSSKGRIWKLAGGAAKEFATSRSPIRNLSVDREGRLRLSLVGEGRFSSLDSTGRETTTDFAGEIADIAISLSGWTYFIDMKKKAVFLLGRKEPVATEIGEPAGMAFWKGGGTLVVGDSDGKHLHAFRVKTDGTLDAREQYYTLRVRPKESSGVKALVIDDAKRLYAATTLGVQVFDPTGRMCGVLNSPLREPVTALAFAGEKRDQLYILCGGKLWVRKTKVKGTWPPAPK